jgi:putative transposase
MFLNQFGEIAYQEWIKLYERFINFELDVFQVMQNHIHMILVLKDVVGATLAVAQNQNNINNFIEDEIVDVDQRVGASPAPTITPSISDIIGSYKSIVSNKCLDI